MDKRYHAVVQGHLDPLRGTIDAPIDRHPSHDYKWAVVSGGRPSVTHYDTLEAFPAASLVDVQLETGRTHQIRVHFSALRHPCVGDLTYGADPTLAARLGLAPAVAARPAARLRCTPGTGEAGALRQPVPGRPGHARWTGCGSGRPWDCKRRWSGSDGVVLPRLARGARPDRRTLRRCGCRPLAVPRWPVVAVVAAILTGSPWRGARRRPAGAGAGRGRRR